jgi:hypothetical protein
MIDIEEIRDARFMSLLSVADSSQAKEFVEGLIVLLKSKEFRKRKRQAEREKAFATAIELIIADLMLGFQQQDNRWSYHQMSSGSFTDEPVGYKLFRSIVAGLEEAGLIDVSLGRNHKGIQWDEEGTTSYAPGLATRFRPTQSLVDMATQYGLKEDEYHLSFKTQLPKKVIEVRAAKVKGEGRGRKLKPPQTTRFFKVEAEIKTLNQFLSGFELTGGTFTGFRRLFNEGNIKGFDYDRGGRLFNSDGQGYIGLSSDERQSMRIGGEDIVEIDINASYLTIYNGLMGEPLPDKEDIYAIDGLPREVVKAWFSVSFGVQKFHTRWPSETIEKLRASCKDFKPSMTVRAVGKKAIKHFPIMADWPLSGLSWSKLMFIESEIVIGTMATMMEEYQAPCFPVHDAIIVRKKDEELAKNILTNKFEAYTNITPRLKLK